MFPSPSINLLYLIISGEPRSIHAVNDRHHIYCLCAVFRSVYVKKKDALFILHSILTLFNLSCILSQLASCINFKEVWKSIALLHVQVLQPPTSSKVKTVYAQTAAACNKSEKSEELRLFSFLLHQDDQIRSEVRATFPSAKVNYTLCDAWRSFK